MENKPTNVEELFYKLKDYGDTRLDLFKLKAINKVSSFMSTLIVSIILIVLLFVVLICITIGFGLLIGGWLGNIFWGFFIMAAIYSDARLLQGARHRRRRDNRERGWAAEPSCRARAEGAANARGCMCFLLFRRRRMWTSGEDYLWNASAASL
jgi:hypothetical protein